MFEVDSTIMSSIFINTVKASQVVDYRYAKSIQRLSGWLGGIK